MSSRTITTVEATDIANANFHCPYEWTPGKFAVNVPTGGGSVFVYIDGTADDMRAAAARLIEIANSQKSGGNLPAPTGVVSPVDLPAPIGES